MSPFFGPCHIPYENVDNWLDASGTNSAMTLKAMHHNWTFGSWDGGKSWLRQHRDCASEAASVELVDDIVLDFFWFRIYVELDIDFWSSTSADKLRLLRSLPTEEWVNQNGSMCCTSRWGTYSCATCEDYKSPFEARRSFLLMMHGVLQGWLIT